MTTTTTTTRRPRPRPLPLALALALALACIQLTSLAAAQQQRRYQVPPHHPHSPHGGRSSRHRLDRPFLVRNLQLTPDLTLPVSPATLVLLFLGLYLVFRTIFHSSTAVASHILLDDQSGGADSNKSKLEAIKRDVGNDPAKFAAAARKYSKCPSGKGNGGSLGKFGRGQMVPPFDRVVFSPETVVGTVVGPVRTNFGWHLILVTERDL